MKFIRRQQARLRMQTPHIQELCALYKKNKQLLDSIKVTLHTYPEYHELRLINASIKAHIKWFEESRTIIMDYFD